MRVGLYVCCLKEQGNLEKMGKGILANYKNIVKHGSSNKIMIAIGGGIGEEAKYTCIFLIFSSFSLLRFRNNIRGMIGRVDMGFRLECISSFSLCM